MKASQTKSSETISKKLAPSGQIAAVPPTITYQNTYNYLNHPGEINNDESETIPGQAYEVEDILRRFTAGQPLNISNNIPQYVGSENFDDIDPTMDPNFDITDVEEITNQIAENQQIRQQNWVDDQEKIRLENERKAG
ncbi:MAG: hypothetical protein [Arizlama microvirus]|nr:MAG: hypothetical protein [Arizlama microvirus]